MVRVAAIDCGTNSVRLLVADVSPDGDGALAELTRRMEIVRLGAGVDRTGRLAGVAIARARVVLAEFASEITRLGTDRVRVVATSALRDAANADEFQAAVQETIRVAPEVVTGAEEALLSYAGAVRGLPADVLPPYLVVDIGGGSTELILGGPAWSVAGSVAGAVSVDVGCVRVTERYLRGDPPTPAEVAVAEAEITATVDRAVTEVTGGSAAVARAGGSAPEELAGGSAAAELADGSVRTLVGLAGSVATVAGIALGLPHYQPDKIHHARISFDEVAKVTADLLAATRAERLAMPVMHPGRADVIGAGALILRQVMARVGAGSVVASEHDLLDGVAWSLATPGSG